MSLQRDGLFVVDPDRCEAIAVTALCGVGADHEWWLGRGEMNPAVAHLRVPTTVDEQRHIPPGLVTMDAGTTGPRRPRTR